MFLGFFDKSSFAWGCYAGTLLIAFTYNIALISLTKRKELIYASLYLLSLAIFSSLYLAYPIANNVPLFIKYGSLLSSLLIIGIGFYGWRKKFLPTVYPLFAALLLLPYSLGYIFFATNPGDSLPLGFIGICIFSINLFVLHAAYQFHLIDQQRDKHQSSTQAKTEFLAKMSHEIRTPLNAIIGMGELLESANLSVDERKYLSVLRSASVNLISLLNDTLDMSKIEAGRIELEKVAFSTKSLITDTIHFLTPAAQKKHIDLRYEIEGELPYCEGDPTRIRQILVNLISNAIKFTKQGFIEVNASLCNQEVLQQMNRSEIVKSKNTFCLLLSVKDTGLGIPADKWSSIFDTFSQADPGINRHFGGSGLGLAITRHLLELMGGRIWVESIENKGTTFFCIIPLKLASREDSEVAEQLLLQKTKDKPKINKPLNILVVEDNVDNQLLLKAYFKSSTHKIDIVNNGKDAVTAITKQLKNFDLVLMDIQMPVMDGLTATREIRTWEKSQLQKIKAKKKIPIYALTAHAFKEELENSEAAGCNGHMTKPIKKDKLFELINCHAV